MDMEVVHTAHNGKEALEKFREEPVDILLTDVEMPLMNGLELIGEIRKLSRRVRCLILSGYDEFEYARARLKMDVEEYILKPINEEQLDRALKQAAKHLDEMDKRNAVNLEAGLGWLQFLKGEGKEKEKKSCEMLPPIEEQKILYPAIMKLDLDSLEEAEGISNILVKLQKKYRQVKPVYLSADVLLCLFYVEVEWTEEAVKAFFEEMQDVLESELGVMSFISVGDGLNSYEALPHAYGRMMGIFALSSFDRIWKMHERGGYPKEEYRRHYDGCKLASKENLGERSGRSPAVRGRVVYELHGGKYEPGWTVSDRT